MSVIFDRKPTWNRILRSPLFYVFSPFWCDVNLSLFVSPTLAVLLLRPDYHRRKANHDHTEKWTAAD